MRHPEFPIASFISIPLLLCSLPSHVRAGSVCTLALIAWMAIVSLIRGINSLVWAENVTIKLEVWCDITTKITIGFTYAIPAAALCILRHLEGIASMRTTYTSKDDKRRRQKIEAVMCFGLPVIGMVLHYIVQGHRLDILEDFGCYPPVYFSVAAIMILWVPPFALSLISFVYATLALRHFLRRRIEFAIHLRSSHSAISLGHYMRLMAMALVEMIWDSGVNAYLVYFNASAGLRPWISWENVHSNFSRVAVFPKSLIPERYYTQLLWQWWIVPISCTLFFIFFAFGEEAMSDYKALITWGRRNILRQELGRRGAFVSQVSKTGLPAHRFDGNVSLSLPSEASSHDPKPWDNMSLKMPDIASCVPTPPMKYDRRSSRISSTLAESRPPSPSLTLNEFISPVPMSAVTQPGDGPNFVDVESPMHPMAQVSFPPVPSSTVMRADNNGTFTSTDDAITISPAYYPNEDCGTSQVSLHLTVPSYSESMSQDTVQRIHPYSGIQITMEKTTNS